MDPSVVEPGFRVTYAMAMSAVTVIVLPLCGWILHLVRANLRLEQQALTVRISSLELAQNTTRAEVQEAFKGVHAKLTQLQEKAHERDLESAETLGRVRSMGTEMGTQSAILERLDRTKASRNDIPAQRVSATSIPREEPRDEQPYRRRLKTNPGE